MAAVAPSSKVLCLSRKDNLYVDLPEDISPNVINGLRFLTKKYFKQNPGVIINEPAGCEQETVVALFLRAVLNTLPLKQVLILCHSSKLLVWTDTLMKWLPDFDDVVAIDSARLTSKKSVYVTTTDRFAGVGYSWREWGVAVVDDDFLLAFKAISLHSLKARYKIFISTDDMKEHLQKFATIHTWLFPDSKVGMDQFKANRNSLGDILEKRIWFAAFVEDFLIRTKNDHMPGKDVAFTEPAPRITRKNKDATGTKIKRTKRKVEDDNTDSANKKIVTNNTEQDNSNQCGSKLDVSNSYNNQTVTTKAECNNSNETSILDISNQNDDMDIESFIRDREPLKMDELKYIPETFIDNMPVISKEMDGTEINSELDDDNSNDIKLNYSEDLDTNDAVYSLETQNNEPENDFIESKGNKFGSNTNSDIDDPIVIVKDTKAETLLSNCNKTEDNVNKENSGNDNEANIEEERKDNIVIDTDIENDTSNSKETRDANKLKSKDNGESNVKENGLKKEGTKSDDLDAKWEEMALKKFKGSLLDRIF